MEPLRLSELAFATQGEIYNADIDFFITGISTDSRKTKPGDLFVPIIGENFDGHSFINKAADSGSIAVLTDRHLKNDELPYIKVENTSVALLKIAGHYRKKFNIPAIAITGSSGKTTAKDMIAAVLSQSLNVLKNEGNFNNTIGLPHTLFNLNKNHEICVLEMGMNSFGEIKQLVETVKPDIAIITNIGTAHIEFLKSREGILKAKLEIIEYFNEQNTLIINGDDELLKTIKSDTFSVIHTGLDESNDIYAFDIKQIDNKGMEFTTVIDGIKESFFIPILGIHNVYNGLCAIAVGVCLGLPLEKIKKGLSGFKAPDMRMESFSLNNGMTIINDAYNANPESVKAAIITLKNIQNKDRKVLILGDMFELGDYTDNGHYEAGRHAALNGIDVLITIGVRTKMTEQGAAENGLKETHHFENNEEAKKCLGNILKPCDTVLIKGSRAAKLEEIVNFLRERR
jgi:UDP-N-acetylmuramoyl-tripeptide--D-alanyl-D-alanine ligase